MTTRLHQAIMISVCGLLCATGALVWTGCDTAGANDSLTVDPSTATLSAGQSQTFKVSGGYHYTWSLEGSGSSTTTAATAQGSLSSLTGSEVLYTAPSPGPLSGSVILYVTSTIEGSGGGTSNMEAYAVSGEAHITFK